MKPFAWSYSRLKNFETCAFKYNEVDNLKKFREENERTDWGTMAHKAFATALKAGTALPSELKDYQHWVDTINHMPGTLYVEQQYAITRDFAPAGYFAPNVWFRAIGDVVKIIEDRKLAFIGDWKTGKMKSDSVQLMLTAQCIFSHFPQIETVKSAFIWLKECDDQGRFGIIDPETFTRAELADCWVSVLERVKALEAAYKTNNYPKKPGGLCFKYCPVSHCEFYKKGR